MTTLPARAARLVALVAGILCHAAFLAGVGSMVWTLYGGMQGGGGTLHGTKAVVADAALLLQFPLLHSFLLSRAGRRILGRVAPAPVGPRLISTTFALVASLQLLVAFRAWSPSGVVWWSAAGGARAVATAAFAGAWLFLGASMRDAGLAVQAGYLGWTAVWRDRPAHYPPMPTTGTFRLCRQPVYLAFALTLWTVPVWTPDALAIALVWTTYCLVGPLHKEARFRRTFGDAFDAYRTRTPYWLPLGARRAGSPG
jgi:protein-S-isoprenylcysteine O-methyltransferase Ste14